MSTQVTGPAEVALEQLTTDPNHSAARRAAIGLASQDAIRQKRAIAKIQGMGGSVALDGIPRPGGEPQRVLAVKLLKGWKGGDAGLAQLIRNRPPPLQAGHLDFDAARLPEPHGQFAHDRGRPADLQIRDEQEDPSRHGERG